MRSSYSSRDVVILLKDITGQIQPMAAREREKAIQSGIHYSELLPLEYRPTEVYMELYREALALHGEKTARAAAVLAEKIWQKKKGQVTLVSLARAGTPIGILIKRYLDRKYQVCLPHYSISIIRDRGIDHNAMDYILARHSRETIQFVDGWIGKGTISRELEKEMKGYPGISPELAVLSDPARLTDLYGTSEDFLIPSACLNAPVSGLFSRTVLNDRLIGPGDFHGAVYYRDMEGCDVSYEFIHMVEQYFPGLDGKAEPEERRAVTGREEAVQIRDAFGISQLNYIKPGIGETTRVLLRRIPWKVLVRDREDLENVGHILRLCQEKEVEVEEYPLVNYKACGLIKELSDV